MFLLTWRAYDPIRSFHGFVLRSNHKHLRLKLFELKRVRFEELFAIIRQDVHDDDADTSVNNVLGYALSNDPHSDDGCIDRYSSD